MAYYPNVWSYLEDQVRNPLKKALKEGNEKEVMEIVDFLICKYIELNAFAKGAEDYALEKGVKIGDIPITTYYEKYVAKYMPSHQEEDEKKVGVA